ncbi:hypothetical protein IPL85_01500 [Candidatus Saccharibacteria bacterium]|nr:MAG: hypothetical protein IPL85_01500 [Candidatus Saccharibacteria bacterium]
MSNKPDTDDLADLTEPFADEASKQLLKSFAGELMPDILENVPVIKTGVVIGKLFNSAKSTYRANMMASFLHGLQANTKTMDEYEKLSVDDKAYIRGIVISQLDLHTDERQAEALALLVDAYLWQRVDRLTFIGIVSELKNTNPLLYYFNVDPISYGNYNGVVVAKGPTYLLPSAFGNTTSMGVNTYDSAPDTQFVLTKLGKAFFEHVYDPMATKYMI